ncbi:hypothetical protein CAEBREN_22524 [Caenorhabditis brenneri]|uniref:Domain of unknown function DB domain-containing protein n=1 Tax=Caenorhabditis brenneri TaxID=135651 RepID=G0MEC1_CAEBE|nr:hypothetical protein CAEBREN_22524 [Caenorhabditis brenneri]
MTDFQNLLSVFYISFILFKPHYGCPPSLSSLNLPPPVIHTECLTRNSCQRGYICRLNRCVGGRALASKTASFDEDDSSLNMEQCCVDHSLPERCMGFCSLENYNESAIFRLLAEPNRCPIQSLRIIHFCASQNLDHLECCQENSIPPHCLDLCSPSHPNTRLDESKLHCLQYIPLMKSCFESKTK